ncbi:pancreatic secretory granule membrane major glycoprotein GP2-like [Myxocyprinus asiaticus]|uniref:pancreatic secretory granule membrane major glycoprotein GP2-like n=1 Tax=Myxocyprinus asiaticus TaxID=70543 RepID=UPI002222F0F0|nr:pancreatic secretory granule membrane major glycoprotein GP2-like [Myxocyprinus asiaticus]
MDLYTACGCIPIEKNNTCCILPNTGVWPTYQWENCARSSCSESTNVSIPTSADSAWHFPSFLSTVYSVHLVFFFSLREVLLKLDEVDVSVEMSLFKDHTYTEAFISASTIKFKDQVYIQIQVTEPEDFFRLKVNECWATQNAQPHDKSGFTHTLLINGCADDNFIRQQLSTSRKGNGEGSTVRYSFEMFLFLSEPYGFYLHCTVHFCTPEDENSCIPVSICTIVLLHCLFFCASY